VTHALILIAGWVGRGFARGLSSLKRPLGTEVAALHERLEKLGAENDLLRARLSRIAPHRRPFYRPWERLAILLHRARYGMSLQATARAFILTEQTLTNWAKDIERGVRRLVEARRPLNTLPDFVTEVAHFLRREWPRWGSRRIAGILAGMGLQASRSSIQRILRRSPHRPTRRLRTLRPNALQPCHLAHVWIVDFTVVRQFFQSIVIGVVIDSFSRKVLSLRAWRQEPSAAETCVLLR